MFTEIKTTIVERDYSQHLGCEIILIKDANGFWGWQVGTTTTPCNFPPGAASAATTPSATSTVANANATNPQSGVTVTPTIP